MPGGVTVGVSGLCCCVPCLLSAINSLYLLIVTFKDSCFDLIGVTLLWTRLSCVILLFSLSLVNTIRTWWEHYKGSSSIFLYISSHHWNHHFTSYSVSSDCHTDTLSLAIHFAKNVITHLPIIKITISPVTLIFHCQFHIPMMLLQQNFIAKRRPLFYCISFYVFIYLRVCLDCKLGASVQSCVCLSVCQKCVGADGYIPMCLC